MPTTIRLSKQEQKDAELKCREINKSLIKMEKRPVSESELIHIILSECIQHAEVSNNGQIIINK